MLLGIIQFNCCSPILCDTRYRKIEGRRTLTHYLRNIQLAFKGSFLVFFFKFTIISRKIISY
ncbi:unnamed protein product [Paramecium octaurelia]|uniref:Uncharacterized protein n=1 Tax=Paramecium octaurelia TaxID=43137 RepID=A0A8S1W9H4_PAROT|nr:unnamed protein product [Paramecium octaurelia]